MVAIEKLSWSKLKSLISIKPSEKSEKKKKKKFPSTSS